MKNTSLLKYYILIITVGILFFVPYLGKVHLFDWDEINFAEAAREMIVTGDYARVRVDFEPFHEKPPLFIWMQAASMKVFGINEFAARFPNALIGIISLLFIFYAGRKIFDEKFGLVWVLTYFGSFLPHFYFKSGLIDPTFNLLMFASMYFLYRYYNNSQNNSSAAKYIIAASILNSLAVLTKGPVGFLLVFITWCVYWFIKRKSIKFPLKEMVIFSLIAALPTIIWYGFVFAESGSGILSEFINYQIRLLTTGDAGHGGPFYYHALILMIGCFPASALMLRGFRKSSEDSSSQAIFKVWNIILLFVVVIIFSIVKTKIVHYSSLAYYPITFLAAYSLYSIIYRNMKWKTSTSWILGIIGFVFAALLIGFPILMYNVDLFLPKVKDIFTYELLKSDGGWNGYEYLTGVFYLFALVATLILIYKEKYLNAAFAIFGSTAITVFLFLPQTAPKIERYTQAAPIEFYKSLQGKEAYVTALGFKSYAPFFYSLKPEHLSAYKMGIDKDTFKLFLLEGKIDKPAYFTAKIKGIEKYDTLPGMEILYKKNGFVFMKRLPELKKN